MKKKWREIEKSRGRTERKGGSKQNRIRKLGQISAEKTKHRKERRGGGRKEREETGREKIKDCKGAGGHTHQQGVKGRRCGQGEHTT